MFKRKKTKLYCQYCKYNADGYCVNLKSHCSNVLLLRGVAYLTFVFMLAMLICSFVDRAREYPLSGIVTELDYDTNEVEFTDRNGNVWVFEGTEDWELYDTVDVIMNTCGTEIVTDDKIVQIGYSKRRE